MKYNVFISYRRENASEIARAVKAALLMRGYSVFLDVDNLPSGRFDNSLVDTIKSSDIFIVILTPSCLERCVEEEDWLRKEIRCAIHSKKQIIPIICKAFSTPDNIPSDIKSILSYEAVTYSHVYFNPMIDRLQNLIEGKAEGTEQFSIIQGKDISANQIKQTSMIEPLVYNHSDFIAGSDIYLNWFSANPDSFCLSLEQQSRNVVGAIIALPLSDEIYETMKSGKILDSELDDKVIVPMDLPHYYNLYIPDVMVAPEYQKWSNVLLKLMQHYIQYLIKKSEDEVYVKRILADVCSEYGKRLCEYIGMEVIKKTEHDSYIYEGILIPPNISAPNKYLRKLVDIYKSNIYESNIYV